MSPSFLSLPPNSYTPKSVLNTVSRAIMLKPRYSISRIPLTEKNPGMQKYVICTFIYKHKQKKSNKIDIQNVVPMRNAGCLGGAWGKFLRQWKYSISW